MGGGAKTCVNSYIIIVVKKYLNKKKNVIRIGRYRRLIGIYFTYIEYA